jgi:hypothetical protein
MYHDRTAWRCAFLWAKNMDTAKDIHKEMLPRWPIATVVKEHSWNTQPAQRHTVLEAVNAVKVEGS